MIGGGEAKTAIFYCFLLMLKHFGFFFQFYIQYLYLLHCFVAIFLVLPDVAKLS